MPNLSAPNTRAGAGAAATAFPAAFTATDNSPQATHASFPAEISAKQPPQLSDAVFFQDDCGAAGFTAASVVQFQQT